MEFDPSFQGELRFPCCSTLFPKNSSSKPKILTTMFSSETSSLIPPPSPQSNNPFFYPSTINVPHIMNEPNRHFFHPSSNSAFVPIFTSATPCLDQPFLSAHHLNKPLIRDCITSFVADTTLAPQNNCASFQSGLNNTTSVQFVRDLPHVVANVASSSSHAQPSPPPPPISCGYGSKVITARNEEELLHINSENNQRDNNGDGGIKRKCKRKKVPNDDNNTHDIIKGQWSSDEDRILKELVENLGMNWSAVAKFVNGRTGKQCRDRWYNHLQPDIKKGPWSLEEEILLIKAHWEVGNKWVEIAKRIPGRTENSIKNRWNASKRRLNANSTKAEIRTSNDESTMQASIKEANATKSTDTDIGLMLSVFFPNYDFSKDAWAAELFEDGGGDA